MWRIEQDYVPQWSNRGERMSDSTFILPSDTDVRPDIAPMKEK